MIEIAEERLLLLLTWENLQPNYIWRVQFLYKRKLSVLQYDSPLFFDKKKYFAVRHEGGGGCGENNMADAMVHAMFQIIKK